MATEIQKLGKKGKELVRKNLECPKCKRMKTLNLLRNNFKCANLICDFCGYLAQVRTNLVDNIDDFPQAVRGGAWEPLKERMDAGIFFPVFFVFILKGNSRKFSIFYLPTDLQNEAMFIPRSPLKATAQRKGWQGYMLDGAEIAKRVLRLK